MGSSDDEDISGLFFCSYYHINRNRRFHLSPIEPNRRAPAVMSLMTSEYFQDQQHLSQDLLTLQSITSFQFFRNCRNRTWQVKQRSDMHVLYDAAITSATFCRDVTGPFVLDRQGKRQSAA
jgi:hypothetical protein